MKINNSFRYSLNNRLGLAFVVPGGEADFKLEWTRQDESRLDYKKELPSKVIFNGEAYNKLLKLEQSIYRCEFTSITVERYCSGSWVPWFIGRISLNNGTWDLDRCTVEIKFDENAPDQCLDDNKTTKINLLSEIATKRTVRLFPDNLHIEFAEYTAAEVPGPCPNNDPYWGGAGTPAAGGWGCYSQTTLTILTPPVACRKTAKWARYIIDVPPGDPPPSGEWVLISSGATDTYAKAISTFACEISDQTSPFSHSYEKNCKILGTDISTIDNGVHLADVLDLFVSTFCSGLTVQSNFFQINPTDPSPDNYITGLTSKVKDLIIFQKSDVKRPGVSGNATIAEMTFEQLTDALVMMFNTRWRVVGSVFIIEHVSYFSKSLGIQLMLPRYAKYIKNLRRYTYETDKIPQREEFKFMEASPGDFAGVPIIYSGACVAQTSKSNVMTFAVDTITTDVQLCLDNPDSESSKVEDKGFVIIASEFIGGEYKIISEPPILSTFSRLNNSLAWAQLHRDYHKYYRPLIRGSMNNVNTTFISSKPTKKGAAVTIPLCCGDSFDPDDLVDAPLGAGITSKASFSFRDNSLTLELLYEPENGLTENTAPVSTNGFIFLVSGDFSPVEKNIVPLVSDADGTGTIVSVEIVVGAGHGTAIVSGMKIIYTPAPGFTSGIDNFAYRVRDNWGEPSNTSLIAVTFI